MTAASASYKLKIFWDSQKIDPYNSNVDVEVVLNSGDRYGATFFTLQNIQYLMEQYALSKECKGGLYFWAADMIVVRELTDDVIRETIEGLILANEFERAFSGPLIDEE